MVQPSVLIGLEQAPEWLECQTVLALGGGRGAEARGARRLLAERPAFAAVIAAIEKVKGRKWAEFRDQYGDPGRDLALFLGRRLCGLKLAELARLVDWRNYGVVAAHAKRYERRLQRDRTEKTRMQQVLKMLNGERCGAKSLIPLEIGNRQ